PMMRITRSNSIRVKPACTSVPDTLFACLNIFPSKEDRYEVERADPSGFPFHAPGSACRASHVPNAWDGQGLQDLPRNQRLAWSQRGLDYAFGLETVRESLTKCPLQRQHIEPQTPKASHMTTQPIA